VAHPTGFELAFDLVLAQLKLGAGRTQARRAASAAREAVGSTGLVFEAGLEQAGMAGDSGLRARLLARRVDSIHLSPQVTTKDLLGLAEALASDDLPLPDDARIRCEMVVDIIPEATLQLTRLPEDTPPVSGTLLPEPAAETEAGREPRHSADMTEEIQRLRDGVTEAAARGGWMEALHAAQALTDLSHRLADRDRGSLTIQIKRLLTALLVGELIDFALRAPEEQDRLVAVLRYGGREALELVVDRVSEHEALGPKRFLLDVLAEAPDAFPLLEGLTRSHRPHAIRLGAHLLARTGDAAAIPPLKAQLGHPEASVRVAVLLALGAFPRANVADALREGLQDPVPSVRVAAAAALATLGSGGVVMPILGALEHERDPDVRLGFIQALGRVDAPEAATVLAGIAMEKRSILTRRGYADPHRVAAVEGLARGTTRAARAALERVAEEGSGAVRVAARTALGGPSSG